MKIEVLETCVDFVHNLKKFDIVVPSSVTNFLCEKLDRNNLKNQRSEREVSLLTHGPTAMLG